MANVSSSNGIEKRPKLRFESHSDASHSYWESHTLADYLSPRVEKQVPTEEAPLMAFTAEGGVEPKGDRYDRSYLVKSDNKLYKRTELGDFIYSSNNLDVGSMGLNKYGTAVISDVYEIFSIKDTAAPSFIDELIHCPNVLHKILQFRQGCLYGQYRIYADDFLSVSVLAPSKAEQQRISDFFATLDEKIMLQRKLIEYLKKYKRGVSKKLFDEIHNDSSCAIKQFSEVFELLQNNIFSRECLTNELADVLNIHYGDILVKYGSVVDLNIDIVPFIKPETDIRKYNRLSYLRDGDIIFADTAEDYTVGKMCEVVNVSDRKILSGLHTMPYRPLQTFAPMYLGYYFNSAAFREQILPMIQGAKVSSISKSEMKKTIVCIPSIETQRKVVNALSTLDRRIKRTEMVLQELQQMKKGLLQNLFI